MSRERYQERIEAYYREQAARDGLDAACTMPDEIVRAKELGAIRAHLDRVLAGASAPRILEIGCGNGLLLAELRGRYPGARLQGVDYVPEMVALARSRQLPGVEIGRGDVTGLGFADGSFDVVVSERVIINLLDREHQARAFAEVARVLAPGGHFLCIEAFAEPLRRLNEARAELALPEIPMPPVNRWFEDSDFEAFIAGRFETVEPPGLPPPTFLSTHYFVTRVLHELVMPAGGKVRNTHFGAFFSAALPLVGDYGPVKLHLLRRLE